MAELSVVMFSVKGVGDGTKRRQVFNYLRDKNPDIVFLQETHSVQKIQKNVA